MKDPNIRQFLKETELKVFYNDNQSKVVEELRLPIANARIDIAVINGALHGYEIKSASDTLRRIPHQIIAYEKVFDYLSVVTEKKYSDKLVSILPDWVGVILCNEETGIVTSQTLRNPTFNSNKQGAHIAKLLWRDELINVLTQKNIRFRKKDRNWLLCETLAKELSSDTISAIVREKLKERDNWRVSL